MRQQWQAWSSRFAALAQREKHLVCAAILALILLGGYNVLIGPVLARTALAEKKIAQSRADLANLGPQVATLQASLNDPDAATRAAIKQSRQQLADLDAELGGFDKQLVAPDKMTPLLQALMTGHRGLELVSLKTLPPSPIIAMAPAKDESKPGDKTKAVVASSTDSGNIYKHGIEIRLAGNYQDLLAYVSEVEHSPQHLLLGRMVLAVSKYPRVELTLTVYSLSLDRTWLVV